MKKQQVKDEGHYSEDNLGLTCLNCDNLIDNPAWPYLYCSELCKQEAKYVRYHRACFLDGRAEREDVQLALQIRLAMILGGGYPDKERHLKRSLRAKIFDRDKGLCYICGKVGNQIDHTFEFPDRGINDPSNLRVICEKCHNIKTTANFVKITPETHPEKWEHAQKLKIRVFGPDVPKICDDELTWKENWLKVAIERQYYVKDVRKGDTTLKPPDLLIFKREEETEVPKIRKGKKFI